MPRTGVWRVAMAALMICFGLAVSARAADTTAAKENYATYCAKCHGDAGKGDGPAAATLKTRPGDFTDCAGVKKYSDDTMFKIIKNGGPAADLSNDMPSWKQGLEDRQIRDMVAYVRGFCPK